MCNVYGVPYSLNAVSCGLCWYFKGGGGGGGTMGIFL